MIGAGVFFCMKANEFMENQDKDYKWLKWFFCILIQPIIFVLGLIAGAIFVPFAAIYGLFFTGK